MVNHFSIMFNKFFYTCLLPVTLVRNFDLTSTASAKEP